MGQKMRGSTSLGTGAARVPDTHRADADRITPKPFHLSPVRVYLQRILSGSGSNNSICSFMVLLKNSVVP